MVQGVGFSLRVEPSEGGVRRSIYKTQCVYSRSGQDHE